MDPPAEAACLLLHGDRVVEVLRGLRVDREAELIAQVDAVGQVGLGRLVGLEARADARVHEQSFEDDLDVFRVAELALEPRAAPAGAHDDQVAGADVAAPLPVDRDRDVRDEVRLADEQLAAPVDLDYEKVVVVQTLRKRRMVKPDPAAPSSNPVPSRISALSEKAIAFTSSPALSGPL